MIGYYRWTKPLSFLLALLGVLMFVIGAIHLGATGMLVGALFFAAGAGRLWLMRRRDG